AALQQSFVLYMPKDIVSGDFYWFNKSGSTVFLAAVDCTGHGVPGAFMSIVGSERLNDAAEVENDPGKMLALLNKGIKRSLR
ncbi:PP2C family protein-serine/threonine phosphatase, partial [Proteus terrae]|uniref:PP2C family protein-serine/threonine phosphatase n=1 Tax=Proteus terrae TaxID=1574161 RepID=UPI00301C7671